jgi:uncharacterized protein (TIGR02145 family)
MKRLLFLTVIFFALKTNAQTYLISFAGTGGSNTVETVKVENLTSGSSLTMNGNDILRLNFVTGLNEVEDDQSSGLKIFPNPMTDNAILQVSPPCEGNAVFKVIDITGKIVAQIQFYLENSLQEFRISGIKSGFYLISGAGRTYQYSGKLLSNGISDRQITIEKIASYPKTGEEIPEKVSRSMGTIVDMNYSIGDRIKFTGISGIYSTVKTDIPSSDKTITFNFIACTDADNNNYQVVEIGNQTWMAENLRTTKYIDGISIPLVTDNDTWAELSTPGYCWLHNDEATFKATFGAIYNWYTIDTENICPDGWHVPTTNEWITLTNYLISNGYNFDGTLTDNKIAKSLASRYGWESSTTTGSVGNTDYAAIRNMTGFTALESDGRDGNFGVWGAEHGQASWWSSTTDRVYFSLIFYSVALTQNTVIPTYGFSVRCIKTEGQIPTLQTTAINTIAFDCANSGGNIKNDGGDPIRYYGVCWSTTPNPTINDSHTTFDSHTTTIHSTDFFSSSLTGLTGNTRYYVRAYATNFAGIGYGDELSFMTNSVKSLLTSVSSLTQTTANCNVSITSCCDAIVTERGVCWNTVPNPTIADNFTSEGSGEGSFISNISGLTQNTAYFVRAYAKLDDIIYYGNELILKTYSGTVTDIDGNIYNTVTIGSQVWMAENLKTITYNNGIPILYVTDPQVWDGNPPTPNYCWLNNDEAAYKSLYGALYNWHTVESGNLCPIGWHVPSNDEWSTLATFLGGESTAGGKLKETGTEHWNIPNAGATNETGFSALPGGRRSENGLSFELPGLGGFWWSSTVSPSLWAISIDMNNKSNVLGTKSSGQRYGLSVRCLKDN